MLQNLLNSSVEKRIRASLFLSIADVFFGVGALILALIVLSSSETKKELIERYVDSTVQCELFKGRWYLKEKNKTHQTIHNWIQIATKTGLLKRIGVEVERSEMSCYREVKKLAKKHNKQLIKRGNIASSLSIVLLPVPHRHRNK